MRRTRLTQLGIVVGIVVVIVVAVVARDRRRRKKRARHRVGQPRSNALATKSRR